MPLYRSMQRLAGLLAVTLICGTAIAQTTTPDTPPTPPPVPPSAEEITVTATRFERPIDLTPQSVSVVDAKEIHAKPLWNVQALLEDVPGVSFQRSGALDAQIVIRGLSSNDSRIVLFIDGDRFRGRNFLEYSLLDPNEIERIEIIRGPAAALYGSDAMNGVVNVITRRETGDVTKSFSLMPRLYAMGFSSSNRMGAARLELAGLGNGFDMLIGANYRTAENYESPAGEIPNSDFRTRSLTARVGYSPNATSRIELNAKKFSDDAGRAGAPGAPLVITREDPLKERFVRLAYSQSQVAPWMQDLEASLYARNLSSILRGETHTAANGTVEFRNTWVKGPLETGGKLLARSVIGNSVLSYGFDAYRENAPPFQDDVRDVDRNGITTFVDPRAKRVRAARQTDLGALAHYDWDPSSRLTVSLGGRYDSVRTVIDSTPALGESPELTAAFARNLSARDSALTGSAGVIFRPMPELHLVGNISTAFRSPTTGDKSGSGIVGALNTLPNAELKPEKSVNYEAGVRVRLGEVNANLTVFRSNYKDLVQFAFLTPTTRQRVNLGRVNVDGFELDGAWQMTKSLAFHFNAADARGTNELTHTPLSYVPPLNGLLAVRRTWNDIWLEVADRWSRDKTRIDRTQERSTDGYQTLNVYSGFDLSRIQPMLKAYRLNIGIENITDKAYVLPATRELIGFPVSPTNPLLEPGRSLTINLTATF